MTTIISGNFQQHGSVKQVLSDLAAAGFDPKQMTSFFLNASGKRDIEPAKNDEDEAPVPGTNGNATDAGVGIGGAIGAAVGGTIGGAVGLVTLPALGPAAAFAAAGVGAYAGSLLGALSSTENHDNPEPNFVGEHPAQEVQSRKSGTWVAVSAPASAQQDVASRIFHLRGATDVECLEGNIVAGEWIDFNIPSLNSVAQ